MKNFERFGNPLTARVAVYVPSTVDGNGDAGSLSDQMTRETASRLSDLFGGATVTGAVGYWNSETLGLIGEAVQIVYSNTTADLLERNADAIFEIVQKIKADMRQEAVSVEINGALYIA